MTLFNEVFLELQSQGVDCEVEVGSDPQMLCIHRHDDPIWVEELSPSEVSVYSHTSEEQYCAGDLAGALSLIQST